MEAKTGTTLTGFFPLSLFLGAHLPDAGPRGHEENALHHPGHIVKGEDVVGMDWRWPKPLLHSVVQLQQAQSQRLSQSVQQDFRARSKQCQQWLRGQQSLLHCVVLT